MIRINNSYGRFVMRYLGVLGIILCLSACATVSMQPASMTTSLLTKESALTKDAKSFTKLAQKKGWVEKSTAMEFLQSRVFVEGATVGPDQTAYVEALQKNYPELAEYSAALQTDIDLAHSELAALNSRANTFLARDDQASRSDVAAFEEALVTARLASVSFEQANDVLVKQSTRDAETVRRTLEAYNREVNETRQLIETIAISWQAGTAVTS